METELKTLKDLDIGEPSPEQAQSAMEQVVKTEAIKDYKHFKERIFNCCGEIKDTKPLCEQCSEMYAVMVYIKWKNNIIDEDLQ